MGKKISFIMLMLMFCSLANASQFIVKLKGNKSHQETFKNAKYNEIAENTYLVEGEVKEDDNIEYVEPNYIWTINNQPVDPLFGDLWGLKNNTTKGVDINAINAWGITQGDRDIKIMVIDTGIDYNHPDLKDNMWTNTVELNGKAGVDDDNNGCIDDIHGCDYANNDGDPMDDNSHGTHCSGTIGASHNNIGVAGVMANVSLVGCKFLTGTGSGSTDAAIKCIDYGIKVGVDVMSNSWGGGGASQALKEAIERARDANILFVAAAGNSGTDNDSAPHYPSNYDVENVISVASYDKQNNLSSFSCYGKTTVHIAAPGSDIMSTVPNNGYKSYSGTSMATPHASGVLGLLLSHESFTDFKTIKEKLMKTSVPVDSFKNKLISGGRIDAYNLLTDTRPIRNEPKEEDWITVKMGTPWESKHPYADKEEFTKSINIRDAKYVRLVIKRMDLEAKYDTITIKGADGTFYETLSGSKSNFTSGYVKGGKLTLEFKSDASVTKWGFLVEEFQYQ